MKWLVAGVNHPRSFFFAVCCLGWLRRWCSTGTVILYPRVRHIQSRVCPWDHASHGLLVACKSTKTKRTHINAIPPTTPDWVLTHCAMSAWRYNCNRAVYGRPPEEPKAPPTTWVAEGPITCKDLRGQSTCLQQVLPKKNQPASWCSSIAPNSSFPFRDTTWTWTFFVSKNRRSPDLVSSHVDETAGLIRERVVNAVVQQPLSWMITRTRCRDREIL